MSFRSNRSTYRLPSCVIVSAVAVCGIATSANAQDVPTAQTNLERFNRQLEQLRLDNERESVRDVPVGQRVLFDYGGYFTFDYLTVDDSENDEHILRQYNTVVYARMNIDGAHEFFARMPFTYMDFHSGDSFSGRGDEWEDIEPDRLYYRFDLQQGQRAYGWTPTQENLVVQVGRDLVYWNNGLVLGQELDGGLLTYDTGAGIQFDAIAGVTPVRTVDFDSSRPAFDYNTRRGFYGLMATADVKQQRPYVYALWQRDYNKDYVLDAPPTTTQFNYNSYYLGTGASGSITDKLLYSVEAVYEGGTNLSNSFEIESPFIVAVPQQTDEIKAWAANARLDYLLFDERRTRFSGELVVASGDSDRALNTSTTFGGNKPGTRDNAFNGFGLINTGLAFAPAVSNLFMMRVGASTFPFIDMKPLERLQAGVDLYLFMKTDAHAPIDEPTNEHTYLGWEPDFFVNWQVTSDVTLAVRYGVFAPSDDAFSSTKLRQYFSTSLTFAF